MGVKIVNKQQMAQHVDLSLKGALLSRQDRSSLAISEKMSLLL